MTKYQNAVMWLGLALVFIRFLTTGQRQAFHDFLSSGANSGNIDTGSLGNIGQQVNTGVKNITANTVAVGPLGQKINTGVKNVTNSKHNVKR